MFAIATPQTVTLTIPGDDHPSTLINFRTNDADTSRCVLEIVTPEGDTHRLTFNVRGQMVDSAFTAHDADPAHKERPLSAADYMVGGVDTRAFDPYTHVPPMTADSAYAPAGKPTAQTLSAEDRELANKHRAEAAGRGKEAREKLLAKADEDPKKRAEREKQERRERLDKAQATLDAGKPSTAAPGLDTGDNPLGDPHAEVKTFPSEETQRLVAGKRMDGSSQQNPVSRKMYVYDNDNDNDNDPMAPAPSSPLPGSPPPHPLDQPDPGKVNTSISLGTPPQGA